MKGNYGLKTALIIILVLLATYLVAYGSDTLKLPAVDNIRFGTDIKGGVYARLYPETTAEVTQEQLDSARIIIEARLDSIGILDRSVYTEPENNRIVLEIPWKPGETDFNPQAVVDELGKTALLTFREVDEDKIDDEGKYLPTDRIVLSGDDVRNATPQVNPNTRTMEVALELTEDAAIRFEEATGRLVNKPIAIFMDEIFISAPIVNSKITRDSSPVITLNERNMDAARKESKELADTIRAGALPFRLEARDLKSISPILGEGALKVAVNAGIVAFIIVVLFMILYYRLPGIIASLALFALVIFQMLAIAGLKITLTLPGIAGIILSVGMGVDANIIIFERIKEELKTGKTLRTAIDLGFKRALAAIADANITTIISAVVLYWLGSGAIRGFAITLGLGVALSFFTAVTVTRIIARAVSGIESMTNKWLYGVGGGK